MPFLFLSCLFTINCSQLNWICLWKKDNQPKYVYISIIALAIASGCSFEEIAFEKTIQSLFTNTFLIGNPKPFVNGVYILVDIIT